MKKAFQIPDMQCSMCVMHLESIEDELDGIHWIKADYIKQSMEVDYDESKVSEADLLNAVTRKGYHIKDSADK